MGLAAVVAGTTEKLNALFPGRIGDNRAFSTAYVDDLIMAGFYEVCDKCGILNISEDITLVADTLLYDLSTSFITVESVEFKSDGTNVDGYLTPVTFTDLDVMSRKWRDDRGARPEYYSLLSAPGTPVEETSYSNRSGSKINIWRPLSSVSAQIITVQGLGIGTSTAATPADVQRLVLVPYVMAHLKAVTDPAMAAKYYRMFNEGCDRVGGRYAHAYNEALSGGRP